MSTFNLELGPNPAGEACIQLNRDDPSYFDKMKEESQRYVEQLRFQFPEWGEKCVWFKVVTEQHEYGPYVEVEVRCNENDEAAMEYCFHVENNIPEKWHENFSTPEAYQSWKSKQLLQLSSV